MEGMTAAAGMVAAVLHYVKATPDKFERHHWFADLKSGGDISEAH